MRGGAAAVVVAVLAMSLLAAAPASAATRNQTDVGANVNCNLNGLHQNQGPVSTCGDLTITTRVLVNGADVPQGTVLAVGDVVTVEVVVPPRGGHDAFYQETVDGIRNNNRDQRFAIRVGLPGETGTNLSAPTNVVMSRTDNGDRGNGPAINCLAHNGQEGARTDGATAVAIGGPSVGSTDMNASVTGTTFVAQWDEMAYDRCVNVLSNNGYYAGFTVRFDQVVEQAGTAALTPTWSLGEVSQELKNGSRSVTWGSNADMALTLGSVQGPVAVPDTGAVDARYAGQPATSVAVDVLANDTGTGPLAITAVTPTTAGGTVDCGPLPSTGPCTYTPPVGHSGSDTFHYTVTDDNGSTTTLVTIVVLGNAAPSAHDDLFDTGIGVARSGSLAGNDVDPDGDPLVYSTALASPPAHGTATLAANGSFTYTPDAGFFGSDSFTYQVCDRHPMKDGSTSSRCSTATATIAVDPGDGPSAVPDLVSTDTGHSVTIDVLANDDEGQAGPATVSFAGVDGTAGTTLHGGTVSCAATCTYQPAAGYSGTDGFVYTITDAAGRTSSTTVTVSVVGNRAPIALADAYGNGVPDAAVTGDLSGNDHDLEGDALVYAATPVVAPAKGTVAIGADGTFTYTPNAGAEGTDSFTYRVCDDHTLLDGTPAPACATAVVTIELTAAPLPEVHLVEDRATTDRDVPVDIDVLANDSGDGLAVTWAGFAGDAGETQAGGSVSCSTVCTYQPAAGFSGTDAFTYTAVDEHGTERSTYVVVTVFGNHAPLPADDMVLTPIDTTVRGSLATNDVELDGEALVYTETPVVAPSHGTVTIAADGSYTYEPDAGWTGVDQFVYEVCDDHVLLDGSPEPECAQATATILVGTAFVDDLPDIDVDIDVHGQVNVGSPHGSHGTGQTGGKGTLARTGADIMVLLWIGGAAAVLGGLVLGVRRRAVA